MKVPVVITVGFLGIVVLLVAGSCAHPISKHLRDEAKRGNAAFVMVLENPAAYAGKSVLWGGKIIEAMNIQDGTEMIVLETPLDFFGAPGGAETTRGRFIARSPQFLDPAVYTDRVVTLAGELAGAEEKTLGKITYKYPIVIIKEFYLWEKYYDQTPADYYRNDPFWGPYYHGHGPHYPHGGGDHH